MTAQVLAALVVDGTVTLDDPIGTWLDGGDNGAITLLELATHTSGLPRMGANAGDGPTFDPQDPFAAYTAEMAEAALRDSPRSANATSEYSNLGFQLLNVALERAANTPFEELLRRHVFEPFGLTTASVGPGPNQVQGYAGGKPTPPWHVSLPGPGGINGTIGDVLAWGRAVLDPPAGPPGDALSLALQPRAPYAAGRVGLAWHFLDNSIVWHNGGTYGTRTCLAISRDARRVAASLVAAGGTEFVDNATFLACAGGDPMEARPAPAGDEHNDAAVEIVTRLAAHRWVDSQSMMSESCATALTVERLSDAWAEVMDTRGAYQSCEVERVSRQQGFTTVRLTLTFSNDTGIAEVSFDDVGLVAGLRIE